jgi:hypothetical protein
MTIIPLKTYIEAKYVNVTEAAEHMGINVNLLHASIRENKTWVCEWSGKLYRESLLGKLKPRKNNIQ